MHNYKQGKCVAVFPCSESITDNIQVVQQTSKKQWKHDEKYPKYDLLDWISLRRQAHGWL
jgi:hypothetical protein